MADSQRDVELRIKAAVTGTGDVQELAGDVRDLGKQGNAASADLQRLADATQATAKAEAAARAELAQAKRAREEQRDALDRLRASTTTAERATETFKEQERALRMALVDSRAAVREKSAALADAQAAARAARNEEQALASAQRQQGQAAASAAQQQVAANEKLRDGLRGIGEQLTALRNVAGAAIGGQLLGGLARDLAQTADSFKDLQARMRLVTGEGPALQEAFSAVVSIAERTSTSLDTTATLFTRLSQAGKEMKLGTAAALQLTEAINQAVAVSGASAESSNAAITQLIQGLQSGVLRGDEFNSVMEQAPRLAQAMAAGLGVTTGELRKMAEAGQLTAQTVIGALRGQAATLQAEYAQLPLTVGRAVNNLSTAWTVYVGEVDKANGASAAAARAIDALARNLDTVAAVLHGAGKAAAAYQAIRLAQTFLEHATAARASTAAIAAETAATTANTAAKQANAVASAAAAGEAAAGVGRFAAALASIKLGVLVAVVTNLKEIGTWLGETAAKAAGWGRVAEENERRLKAEEEAARANAQAKAAMAQAAQLAADKALGLTDQSRRLVAEFDKVRTEGASVEEALKKVAKEMQLGDLSGIAAAGAALDALGVRGKAAGRELREALGAALKDVDLGVFATQAAAAFDKTEQGVRRLKLALDAVAEESLRRAGTSAEELATGFSKAASAAINDVDTLARTLDQLGVRGVDAGRALARSLDQATGAASTERALREVIARLEEFGRKGLLSGEQVAEGIEKARRKIEDITPGVNSLAEAFHTLGMKATDELARLQATSKQAWERIRDDATVSMDVKREAFRRYAEAVMQGNDTVAKSWLEVEAKVYGVELATKRWATTTADASRDAVRSIEAVKNSLSGVRIEDTQPDFMRTSGSGENKGFRAVDNTALTSLQEKYRNGTLTADDATLAAQVYGDMRGVYLQQQRNQGAYSLEGFASGREALISARNIYDKVNSPSLNVGSTTHTVNVNLGGSSTSISTRSAGDSQALVNLIQQLQDLSNRSGP